MMETRIQRIIIETLNGRALEENMVSPGSMRIAQLSEHAAMHDCEDADLVALDLVDDAVGITPHLTEAAGVLRAVECRLSPGLRPANTERAETRRHGEDGGLDVEFTGQAGKRAISGFPFDRRCFAYVDLARIDGTAMPGMPDYATISPCQGMGVMFVAPLGDRKRMERCVCQLRNSSPCLRASARSVLTGRRSFEGRVKR